MRRYGLVDIPEDAEDINAVPISRTITINGTTYDLSANRSWTVSGSMAIGANITSATQGSVLFAGVGGILSQDNTNFFWDDTNNFLRVSKIIVNRNTDNGNKLQVTGQADFGDIAGSLTGVIAYSSSTNTRLGILNGLIWHTNAADVSLWFDAGGTGLSGGQPVRIYSEPYAGVPTQYPLCIQGNGLETIFGQNTITTNASSLVTMVSTTKGFLPPRMTSAQRTAIGSPATGLIVYQTDGSAGLYVRNAGAWQLLGSGGGGGGTGTVTSVSVVSANGFAGTVANATTTPAITLSTTVTGLLKGNGTAISAATAGTDYQAPITLTTTGRTGTATFVSNTLNIPNYTITLTTTGTTGTATLSNGTLNIPNYTSSAPTADGTYIPTISTTTNCSFFTTYALQYFSVGNIVHVAGKINFSPSNTTNPFSFYMSIPVSADLTTDYNCGGTCVRELDTTGSTVSAGSIQGGGTDKVFFFFATANSTAITDWYFTYTYLIISV